MTEGQIVDKMASFVGNLELHIGDSIPELLVDMADEYNLTFARLGAVTVDNGMQEQHIAFHGPEWGIRAVVTDIFGAKQHHVIVVH